MSPPPPLYPDGSNEAVRQEATPSRKRVRKDCQSSPSKRRRVAKTKKGDLHLKYGHCSTYSSAGGRGGSTTLNSALVSVALCLIILSDVRLPVFFLHRGR